MEKTNQLNKRKGDGEGLANRKRKSSNGVCKNGGVNEGGDVSYGRSDQLSRCSNVGGTTCKGPMTRRRKREAEIERKRNLQLHEMTPVVVLVPILKGYDGHGILEKRSRAPEVRIWRETRKAKRQEVGIWRRTREVKTQDVGLRKHLPPEMIEMIMSKVTDAAILQNCSLASPVLSGILWPRKPKYLFNQAFPHIIQHLSGADIYNCRLTARDWRKGVDQVIPDLPTNQPYCNQFFLQQMENRSARLNCGVTPYTEFNPTVRLTTTNQSLVGFQETYMSLNFKCQNSFFGNSLELSVELENPPDHNIRIVMDNRLAANNLLRNMVPENWSLIRFVMIFCDQIHHLKLKLEAHQHFPAAVIKIYTCAQIFLTMCVNLKTFSMSVPGHLNQHLDQFIGSIHSIRCGDRTPDILTHLHTMELILPITISKNLMIRILNHQLPTLQKLTISRWMDSIAKDVPCLKELNVVSIDSEANLKKLDGIRAPPLEKLTLRFGYSSKNMKFILPVLRQFPLLHHLTLDWVDATNARMMEMLLPPKKNQIPTVHTLMMAHSLNVNYSFLLYFPNLRHLFLKEHVPSEDNMRPLDSVPPSSVLDLVTCHEVVEINKFLYRGLMSSSNVWKMLPKLRTIVFERVRYPTAAEEVENLELLRPEKWKVTWERRED